MKEIGLSIWLKSRIERALLWFLRLILILLLVVALLRGEFLEALALGAILVIHGVIYLVAPRIEHPHLRRWGVILMDIVLAGLAFYLIGDVDSQGIILGFCVVAIIATRLGWWQALAVNTGVCLLFMWPYIHSWLWQNEPFSFQIVTIPIIMLALTFGFTYLISIEDRQTRVSQDTTHRLQKLSTIYEVGRTITSTLEMETVLDLVMSKAVEILNAEAGSLLLVDKKTDELVFRVVLGPVSDSLIGQRLPPGEGIVGAAIQTGQGQIVNDVQLDPRWYTAPDTTTGFETQSILCVPLISRGRPVGALEVINKLDGTPFDEKDLELLSTFAAQAAVALENARLYEETNQRLQQVNTLYEVGRSLATLDTDQVLNTIAEQTVAALDVDACGVFLHEQSHLGEEWTVIRALYDPDDLTSNLVNTRFNLAEHNWLREIIRESGYAAFESVQDDEQLQKEHEQLRQMLMMLGIRSCLFVGLYIHDEPRGFIIAAERDVTRTFSQEEIQLCQALAHQAVIAVENASLYEKTDEELNKRVQELATIEEIDHELSSTLDYDRIINLVLQRAIEVCNAQSGLLGILAPDGKQLDALFWQGEQPDAAPDLTTDRWSTERGIIGHVVRTGKPLLLEDVTTDPNYEAILPSTRTELAVPVKRENRVIGVLNLESNQPAAFTVDDRRFLEHLAEHAGIAIENARLFQEERQRVRMLSAIGEVSREILSSLDLERTLNLILARVKGLVDYNSAEICLWDEALQVMVTWGAAGDPRYTSRAGGIYHLDEGFTGWIARHQQQLFIPDTASRPDIRPKAIVDGPPIRSYVGLPLRTSDAFVGTLELASIQPWAYTGEHLEILQIFANQAAVAIQNARLHEETQRRLREFSGLHQISQAIGSLTDTQQIHAQLNERIAHLMGVEMCGILLYDEVEQALVSQPSFFGVAEDVAALYRLPIEKGSLTWQLWQEREYLLVNEVENESLVDELGLRPLARATGLRDTVFAPMIIGSRRIGVIQAINKIDGTPFNEDDVQLLCIFANQAAAVVENARLFSAQQNQLREMGILFETSAAISSSLELDEVLSTVARYMTRALNVAHCTISDWDPDKNVLTTLIDESSIPSLMHNDIGDVYSLNDYPATAETLHKRQPLVVQVSDPDADPAERALLEKFDEKSLLMMPLVAHNNVVGLVELYENRHVREFSSNDIHLCQALANQAAIAIENARLYEQTDERLQARVDEMTALQRTTQELNATLALDRILQVVLESAIQTTRATHGNVMLMDMNTGQFVLRAAQGYSVEEQAIIEKTLLHLDENSITHQVAQSGKPHIVDDAALEPYPVCVRGDTRSALAVPVHYEGSIVGIIHLRHTDVEAFDQEAQTFIQALAEQAAIAIGNALRYEDQIQAYTALRRRAEQMGGLLAVSQSLRADVPLENTLEEVAYAIQETVGYNIVLISVVEHKESAAPMLRRVAAAGLPLHVFEEAKQIRQPLERYENVMREEYQQGLCYFFPFQKENDWGAELHLITPMAEAEDWEEGQWHARDMLLVPLRGAGGRLIGHISVDEPRDGQRPSRQTLEALALFANQAAIAVENANLYFEAQHRADSLALINKVGQALTQATGTEQVLDTVTRSVVELLRCQISIIFLKDPIEGKLVVATTHGIEATEVGALCPIPEEGPAGRVVKTGTPLLISDTTQDPHFVDRDSLIGSMVLVPITAGRQVLGVLAACCTEQHALFEADQVLLTTLADQTAVALESVRLLASTQQAAMRLGLLNEIGRRATSQLELQEILETTVQALHQIMGYFRVAVLLVDEATQELYVAAADDDFWSVIPTEQRHKVGNGLIGIAAATGRTILANNAYADERLVVLGEWKSPSSLSVPIKIAGKVVGVLEIEGDRLGAFTEEEDAAALEIAADQLAIAIENARLFAAEARRRREAETLRVATLALSTTLNLQEILEMILSELRKVVPYDSASVQQLEGNWIQIIGGHGFPHLDQLLGVGFDITLEENPNCDVVRTREPLILDDAPALYEGFRQEPHAQAGTRSWLGVPLLFGDRVIGMIALDKKEPGFYTEEHARLALAFAAQAAIAIQNARLFQQTQRRVAELATVNEIGRAISGALDADQLAELIFNQVSKLLDTSNFHIALYDPDQELIHVDFWIEGGQRQSPAVLKLGQGLTSYLVRTGEPILLAHGTREFHQQHGLQREGTHAKSWLGVPMLAEDRAIGAIAVQSYDEENAFDSGHLELLTTIAGQAAIAFQNASLFREREQRISELAVLNEMAQAISSTLEFDDLLETIYQQVSQLMDTTFFYIATYEGGSNEWSIVFQVKDGQRQPVRRFTIESGLTGYIIRNRTPVLLRDSEESAAFHAEQGVEYKGKRSKSWLGVPMVAEDKVLGVIAVHNYEQERIYGEEHLNFLSTIAAQAAVAVRNAQLYQQIVRFSTDLEERVEARTQDLAQALHELTLERDRTETLYRITSELGASLELERVLQRALQLFADTLKVTHGTITLVDLESGHLTLKATLDKEQKLPEGGTQTPLKWNVGLAGWVMEHREPVLVPDIRQDPRWIELPDAELDVSSVVAAPLSLGGGDVLGVLTLGHSETGYFAKEHQQMVTAAASQVAIAVNNSELYSFITEQAERVGRMLQEQEAEAAKSRAILESIADGVLVLDHNGRVLLVNPTAEELLGFAAVALQGEHFRHMLGLGETPIHRELAQALYTELRNRMEAPEGDEARLQASTVRLEAGNRVLAINIAPLITTIGGTPGLVAALRDVSREAEVERLKNEFISTVSHELRTPMTSIKGYTDLLFLGMAGGLTDAQRNFLQIIKSNADRLTALVNDILDISRIETGRIQLTIEQLNLAEIITQVTVAFQEQYRDKGLDLIWQAPEKLPLIRGDAARLTQVLNNLVANAWHYTPSGGSITISVQETSGFLQVDIKDTGIGIAPDDLPRIFDRFYRVDHPVVQEAEGTGLGLSIVKMFVEMLGGDIWVESELEVGTTFSFTMPLTTTDLPEEETTSADLLTSEPAAVISRRPKVLVVEDDRDLALLLRRQLESEGYQVLLAGSGEDALWLAKEEQPQLITLDVMLPDLDGFVVLEQLKEHPSTAPIPVVIVSILSDPEKGYAMGAVDYVVKPFDEEKLLASVRQALAPQPEGEPYKLLVVDDDPEILSFLDKALSYHGYQVETAPDGQNALSRVTEIQPDLILLDLRMPGVDGYEVIRRLKSSDSTRPIPIIVATASPVDKEVDKVRVLGMGAAQYMTKPLSIETLVQEIRTVIEERQQK